MKPLAVVSAAVLMLAAGDAIAQADPIESGQTLRGRIDRNERLPNGDRPGDCYSFTLDGPSEVTVTMRSRAFDTYVYVFENGDCEGYARHEDDDGDGEDGNNSLLFRWIEAPGVYSIGASAFEDRDRGDYTLALSVVPDPPPEPEGYESLFGPEMQNTISNMLGWSSALQGPANPANPPATPGLPPLSSILPASPPTEMVPPPPPPPPPPARVGPERPYLRLDDAMIAFLAEGSPKRNGQPFICWNMPGSSRLEMRLGSEFPARVEVFEGADCPGQPIFRGQMTAGDVGYLVSADTSPSRPRSVGVSSATGQLGMTTMSAEAITGGGSTTGASLRPRPASGTLSSPLPPAPVPGAEKYTTTNPTCRGTYDALSRYLRSDSAYRANLSVVSSAEYGRRLSLVPAGSDEFDDVRELTVQAGFFGALATAVISSGDNSVAIASLLVAEACDRRFGFTPVTAVPE